MPKEAFSLDKSAFFYNCKEFSGRVPEIQSPHTKLRSINNKIRTIDKTSIVGTLKSPHNNYHDIDNKQLFMEREASPN